MFHRFSKILICATAALCCATSVHAQDNWYSYQLVPHTVYEKKPVTVTTWVNETVNEKRTVTSYKPVWQTETRERTKTSYKPVKETSEKEVKTTLYKPFTETLFREKRTEETVFEKVTQFRDEEYTVREPVMETSMREERVTVRKPVTQKLIEVKKTTTYKPVMKAETQLVPAQIVVPGVAINPNQRPRMQMLQPGYYTDPATGLTIYRRRGLHWVSPTIAAASVAPALLPVQKEAIGFEPKTVEERKPVEVTRYVDEIETRKVPVEVERMVERVKTRRVPYEVKIPKTKVTIEQIPYTQTTYKEEVVVKKVPFTETSFIRVEETEPYEVEVKKWVPVTREVDVPKQVRRKVERTVMQDIPRTVLLKVPVDACGNRLAGATEIYDPTPALEWPKPEPAAADTAPNVSTGIATTRTRRPVTPAIEPEKIERYTGEVVLEPPKKTLDETSERKSILEDQEPTEDPIELQDIARAEKEGSDPELELGSEVILPEATMPEQLPTETGDEKAGERPPKPVPAKDEDDRI